MIKLATKSWVKELVEKVVAKNKSAFGIDGKTIDFNIINSDKVPYDSVIPVMEGYSSNYGSVRESSYLAPDSYGTYYGWKAFSDKSPGWFAKPYPKVGEWVEYISNEPITFDIVGFIHSGGNGYSMSAKISISDDGIKYQDIASFSNIYMNQKAMKIFTNRQRAKYIRLTCESNYPAEHGSGFHIYVGNTKNIMGYTLDATAIIKEA